MHSERDGPLLLGNGRNDSVDARRRKLKFPVDRNDGAEVGQDGTAGKGEQGVVDAVPLAGSAGDVELAGHGPAGMPKTRISLKPTVVVGLPLKAVFLAA